MSSTQNNPLVTESPTQIITSGMMVQESGSRSSGTFKNERESTMGGITHVQSTGQIALQKSIDADNARKIETKLLALDELDGSAKVQAYLDALGDISDANPAFAGAIKLIQNGIVATHENKPNVASNQKE